MRHGWIYLCTCIWMVCLFFKVPSFIPGWFFPFEVQSLSFLWMLCWGVLICVLLFGLPKFSEDKQVLLLFLGAWLLPVLLSLAGTQSLIDHCVQSGHSEFVITGSRGWEIGDVIRNYEQIVLSESQRYAASKPPGQVLVYSILNVFSPSNAGDVPSDFIDGAHWSLSLVLTVVLPLLAATVVFPMFSFAKSSGIEKPWFPVALFVFSAPFSLIVMHMDQVLYPMIASVVLLMSLQGIVEKSVTKSITAGVIFGVGCFISFSLLPLLLLIGLVVPFRKESWPFLLYGMLGFVLIYVILLLGWGYNPIVRYQNAMIHHAQWKGFPWTWGNWWIATRVNIAEFFLWMGPLVPLFFSSLQCKKEKLIFLSVFSGLLFFGKAAGEVARLWLFLMPLFWIWICREQKNCRWEYLVVMVVWTALMKWQMDF